MITFKTTALRELSGTTTQQWRFELYWLHSIVLEKVFHIPKYRAVYRFDPNETKSKKKKNDQTAKRNCVDSKSFSIELLNRIMYINRVRTRNGWISNGRRARFNWICRLDGIVPTHFWVMRSIVDKYCFSFYWCTYIDFTSVWIMKCVLSINRKSTIFWLITFDIYVNNINEMWCSERMCAVFLFSCGENFVFFVTEWWRKWIEKFVVYTVYCTWITSITRHW